MIKKIKDIINRIKMEIIFRIRLRQKKKDDPFIY